jgi:peptidoglycan-N-acetylglucosamine deacetylase
MPAVISEGAAATLKGSQGSRLRSAARAVVQAGLEIAPLGKKLYWRIPKRIRAVALTFDDGPHPVNTPRILHLLREFGARATFFLVGDHALLYPELVRQIAAEGHTLGNHTSNHVRCPMLDAEQFAWELDATDVVLRELGGAPELPVFRPPFGAITPRQALQLTRTGRHVVLWSQDARDYRSATVADIRQVGER